MRIRHRLSVFACTVALALVTVPAFGSTIYETGFENPSYTPGSLAGQDGWSVFGSTAIAVQGSVVRTGAQAASVSGNANGQSGAYHNNASAASLIELSADLYLTDSTSNGTWQFAALGAGLTPFIGGIDIGPTGAINLITAGFALAGPVFTRDVWHNVSFIFDFTTQRYSFSFDGVVAASNLAFCGDNSSCTAGNATGYVTQVFDTFGSQRGDVGYLDNLRIATVDAAVPEPTTSLLLGTGLAVGFLARRLRR